MFGDNWSYAEDGDRPRAVPGGWRNDARPALNEELFAIWEAQDQMERMSLEHFDIAVHTWMQPPLSEPHHLKPWHHPNRTWREQYERDVADYLGEESD